MIGETVVRAVSCTTAVPETLLETEEHQSLQSAILSDSQNVVGMIARETGIEIGLNFNVVNQSWHEMSGIQETCEIIETAGIFGIGLLKAPDIKNPMAGLAD